MEDIIEKMTHIAIWLKAVSLSPYSRCHEKAELLLEACKRIKKLEAENKRLHSLLKEEVDDGRAEVDDMGYDAWLEQHMKG